MKHLILITIFLILNSPAFSQQIQVLPACEPVYYKVLQNGGGEYKCYGENGVLIQEGYFKGKKAEGTFKTYHPNGNLAETGQYTNGYKEGEWKQYYPSGKLLQIERYKSGRKEGHYVGYYESDSLWITGKLANNYQIGEWIEYYPSGNVKSKSNYDESGKLDGPYVEYHENKQIKTSGQFDSENNRIEDRSQAGTWIEYYSNGYIKSKKMFDQNGLLTGRYTDYFEGYNNGRVRATGEYGHNRDDYSGSGWTPVRIGSWVVYHPNGKVAIEYVYAEVHLVPDNMKDGKLLGVYQYDEQGNRLDTGTFKNGNGLLRILDENGNVQQEIVMENGYPKEN